MFKNYLRIAFRNLIRQRGYSAINITGLAIGMAACLLILIYVRDELSYDTFRPDADRLYRGVLKARLNGKDLEVPMTAAPLARTLAGEMPEVEAAARLRESGNFTVKFGETAFNEKKFLFADSNLPSVLSIRFLEGDPRTALTEPFTLVVTDEMAKKYFGDQTAVGQTLVVDGRDNYKVTGVVEAIPPNSHVHFDFLASYVSRDFGDENMWLSNNGYTYVIFKKGHQPEEISEKLQKTVVEGAGPLLKQVFGVSFKEWEDAGGRYSYYFQKVTDIHLYSNLHNEVEPNGNILYVYVFSLIAVFILLLACINFMNLTTARSTRRSKEVGVRKALGSAYSQLVQMFLIESILISMAALGVAILLIELIMPWFNTLTGKHLSLPYLENPLFVLALLAFAAVVGVIAGGYPAFMLSAFSPSKVLKGDVRTGPRRSLLRSGLVVFQFSISVVLIIGTMVVYRQLEFIQQKDLGFKKDNTLVIDNSWLLRGTHDQLKADLKKIPGVLNAGYASTLPGLDIGNTAYIPEGGDPANPVLLWRMRVDYDALDVLGVTFKEGRNYSPKFASDSSDAVIVNEAALPFLGFQEGVGKIIRSPGREDELVPYRIIGVTHDFHFMSLHETIRPLAIHFTGSRNRDRVILRIQSNDMSSVIARVQEAWTSASGGAPFEYFFLDEKFNALYRAEQNVGQTMFVFSGLGILVACLGLFGLSNYATEQRTKEIGIRKVLGASVAGIVGLLSKEFMLLVIFANVIGWPVAYFTMNAWLEKFAYRTSLSWTVFAVTGIFAVVIALLTVSFKAVKTARMNPVSSLRYE